MSDTVSCPSSFEETRDNSLPSVKPASCGYQFYNMPSLNLPAPLSEAPSHDLGSHENPDPTSTPAPYSRRPGRRITRGVILIQYVQNQKGKPLKKEYVRVQIIRFVMKIVCLIEKNKCTQKMWKVFEIGIEPNTEIWNHLVEIFKANRATFKALPRPPHCYNTSYCKEFYSQECVRKFHYYAGVLIYGEEGKRKRPEELCRKLKEYCCRETDHTESCEKAWGDVREYVLSEMMHELSLPPYFPPTDADSSFDPSFVPCDQMMTGPTTDLPEEITSSFFQVFDEKEIDELFADPWTSTNSG